jgi:hypothetical protein
MPRNPSARQRFYNSPALAGEAAKVKPNTARAINLVIIVSCVWLASVGKHSPQNCFFEYVWRNDVSQETIQCICSGLNRFGLQRSAQRFGLQLFQAASPKDSSSSAPMVCRFGAMSFLGFSGS